MALHILSDDVIAPIVQELRPERQHSGDCGVPSYAYIRYNEGLLVLVN